MNPSLRPILFAPPAPPPRVVTPLGGSGGGGFPPLRLLLFAAPSPPPQVAAPLGGSGGGVFPPLRLLLFAATPGGGGGGRPGDDFLLPPWFRVLLDDGTDLPGTGPYEDLVTAMVAWLRGDPDLVAAFPGGVVNARAAPRQEFPYLRFTEAVEQDTESDDDREFDVTFSAYASDGEAPDEEARRLAGFLLYRLDQTDTRAPLRFETVWRECSHLAVGRSSLVPVPPAANNVPAWRCDQLVRFRAVREILP